MATAPKKPQPKDKLEEFARETFAEARAHLEKLSPEERRNVEEKIAELAAKVRRRVASEKR